MPVFTRLRLFAVCIALSFWTCHAGQRARNGTPAPGLKDHYREYFPIGASVSPRTLRNAGEAGLIKTQFNSLTAENVMKAGPIHPRPNAYNWGPADAMLDFAKANNMKMRGHTLVWHQQQPDWFFKDAAGKQIGKDTLFARMQAHISAVVGRYKDRIYAWDVVNEAVSDDNAKVYREESPFYQIAGTEYIAKAFEYAHAADPGAKLFYNDYNAIQPGKVERIYTLLKTLLDAGVPVHGMGIQGHWSVYGPSEQDIRHAIEKYASLGLEVQITELDVSIYPPENHRRDRKPDEPDTFTPELQQKQAEQYGMFFRVFRDYKSVLTGVTFWNVSDRYSWLDNFPVRGRKNYPLLFDQALQPKQGYFEVVDFEKR
ncbi:MAG: endo-1,4-beta-xylanase [Lewinellaceae bacterium]|nr:endo-1,4-beta-xylanase [Saprospiraceae bacterium]MCB9332700.1 endo-1,4-beta-xylanase [Lewinellaceae bacterium]